MADTTQLPVLYILLRNDMASMNAGKGMAQASHASNAFVFEAESRFGQETIDPKDIDLHNAFEMWKHETTQGFGTVLVLAVNEQEMRETVDYAKQFQFPANTVFDPTYPLIDGETVHFIPVDTCAYVFVSDKNEPIVDLLLGRFPLHP